MKHTPGPWNVFPIQNHAHHHTYYKVGNSTTDDVRHATSVCNVTTRNNEQAKANAELIAKAPEMLEAIKNMYSAIDLMGNQDGSFDHFLLNSSKFSQEDREVIMDAVHDWIKKNL